MAEDTVDTSLAIRARRLSALSRARSETEQEQQAQNQIKTALGKLQTEITTLGTTLRLHSKLNEVGAPVHPIEGLAKPATKLREQVESIGRPTLQFLTARTRDVTTAYAAIAADNKLAWKSWADASIAQLPQSLIPRLGASTRSDVIARISDLKKTADMSKFTASDITVFVTTLESVQEILADVGTSDLDVILAKFGNGRVRLADLSEEELLLLQRDEALADQLYLALS
ncbi:hypothetical protein ACFWPA_08605 [Rhodococcus sp. NPDC058505]|uniref:hypothetical protein n=1 Tax=unclassified Rhodococcus (in: high G+C Gram-positive bacteria) TaxID=192944 RepID=UPI00364A110E